MLVLWYLANQFNQPTKANGNRKRQDTAVLPRIQEIPDDMFFLYKSYRLVDTPGEERTDHVVFLVSTEHKQSAK